MMEVERSQGNEMGGRGDGGSFELEASANGRVEVKEDGTATDFLGVDSGTAAGNTEGTATGTFDEEGLIEVERTGSANGNQKTDDGLLAGNVEAEATRLVCTMLCL